VLERFPLVFLGDERGRDLNDGDDSGDGVLLDAAADFQAAHVRELHIAHDQVRHQLARLL
jgi:hypothetical protein